MTMRPDPTFHASPKLAMEAPPENFAYTLLLSPDFSKPDALAVIDVKPGSPTFSQIVHTVTMPYTGDEFHHCGWNACSSSLSPLTGHAFLERRYLIIPGLRSSRIYVVDTKPDPTKAKIHKIIEPEEVFKKTGYSRPHTVHCGPEGIYVSTLGGGGKDGTNGPPGVFIMDCETFDILGRWEIDRGAQNLPGNWESSRFNLPLSLHEAIPTIGKHDTVILLHNDAVVQGLSEAPFMIDVAHWGVLTIGTGLGNARFTNRTSSGKD